MYWELSLTLFYELKSFKNTNILIITWIKYHDSGIIHILWYCNDSLKDAVLTKSSLILPQGNYGFTPLSRLCRLHNNNHSTLLKLCIYLSPSIASQIFKNIYKVNNFINCNGRIFFSGLSNVCLVWGRLESWTSSGYATELNCEHFWGQTVLHQGTASQLALSHLPLTSTMPKTEDHLCYVVKS